MRTGLKITVLAGDGIGVEVTREAVRVLRAVARQHGYNLQFQDQLIGGAAIRETGYPLPSATLTACLESDAVLLGAVGGPEFDSLSPDRKPESGLLALRQALGAFANLRPACSYRAIEDCSPLRSNVVRDANILVVRELLGGLYFGEPRGFTSDDAACNTMRYTADEIARIAGIAFQQARARRHKVTSVDKANVLETSQLWRKVVTRVGREFTDVTLDHMYVDACAMHLVTNPSRFDVILTENLFGDILSDESAVISGTLGMLASASIGGRVGLFEPVHGSAPDIAGRGTANPLGAIGSAALLLRYAGGMEQDARNIELAITEVLDRGYRTADLIRDQHTQAATTEEMGSAVADALSVISKRRPVVHAV